WGPSRTTGPAASPPRRRSGSTAPTGRGRSTPFSPTATRSARRCRLVPRVTMTGPQAVVAIASLSQRVRPERRELLGFQQLVDEVLVEVFGVEVVDDLAALVTQPAVVLEVPRSGHGGAP